MTSVQVLFVYALLFTMSEQGYSNKQENIFFAQKTLKVRPCFIRLLRDHEVDQRLSKKCKKNETEVNKYFILLRILLINFFFSLICFINI